MVRSHCTMHYTWFIKMSMVCDLERECASFLRAWLMRRACTAICASPISPSSSARGTRAATWIRSPKQRLDDMFVRCFDQVFYPDSRICHSYSSILQKYVWDVRHIWAHLQLTLSTTMTSIDPLRIKVSVKLRACSPQSGCANSKSSVRTPRASANDGSKACSASINTQ